jgi:hypothetical protein
MGKYARMHLMGKRTGKAIHYVMNHTLTGDFANILEHKMPLFLCACNV